MKIWRSWGYDGGGWRTETEIRKKPFVPFRTCLHSLVLLLTKQLIQVCQLLLFTLVNAKCIPNSTAGVPGKPVPYQLLFQDIKCKSCVVGIYLLWEDLLILQSKCLTLTGTTIALTLAYIFNLSLAPGHFLNKWNMPYCSTQQTDDKKSVSDYRQVSLQPVTSKDMEQVQQSLSLILPFHILNQFTIFLCNQFGYFPNPVQGMFYCQFFISGMMFLIRVMSKTTLLDLYRIFDIASHTGPLFQ